MALCWRRAYSSMMSMRIMGALSPCSRQHAHTVSRSASESHSSALLRATWSCVGVGRPTMVVPGSHRGPVYDHHTDGLFVGGIDAVVGAAAGCKFESAAKLCGPAGSVSVHHVRAVHGSDYNRSERPRRILFMECIGADAWPLLGCKEFGETPVGEGAFDSLDPVVRDFQWWHHAPTIFDADTISLRSVDQDREKCLRLTLPETDGRGTPVMGTGVSAAPRYALYSTP